MYGKSWTLQSCLDSGCFNYLLISDIHTSLLHIGMPEYFSLWNPGLFSVVYFPDFFLWRPRCGHSCGGKGVTPNTLCIYFNSFNSLLVPSTGSCLVKGFLRDILTDLDLAFWAAFHFQSLYELMYASREQSLSVDLLHLNIIKLRFLPSAKSVSKETVEGLGQSIQLNCSRW